VSRLRAAPWPVLLKIVSLVSTLVLGGAAYVLHRTIPYGTQAPFAETFGTWIALVPPLILVGSALFIVTGYEVATEGLGIGRLLWTTHCDWLGLEAAWHDPAAMKGSLRIWGNGGLYSVTGFYRNRALGSYRAFVTDPKRAVVLRFTNRTLVVSPADPDAFLRQLALVRPEVRIGDPRASA